jgi:thiol-disulfide isomerase/thioredoxin
MALLWACVAMPALSAAIAVGDSLESVLAAKGEPEGIMEAGNVKLLRYPDQTIRVEGGKVKSIKATPPPTADRPKPVAAAKPASPTAAPGAPKSGGATWLTDFEAATDLARMSRRPLLLFFTGSDWCGWCKRLEEEVLTSALFARYAAESLVLLKVDFPRGTPLPAALEAQNKALAGLHKIEGFPTVVLQDPEGRVLGQLGYRPGGPEPFVTSLRRLTQPKG